MTSIKTLNQEIKKLEEQKTIFLNLQLDSEDVNSDIYVREQKALSDVLIGFCGVFPEDVEVEITRGSIYFKMDHPYVKYKKELFNIYLRETYNFKDTKKSYDGIDLSYYTTSTEGIDSWELRRLQMLGKIAEVIYEKHDEIVDVINNIVFPFKMEFEENHKKRYPILNSIGELNSQIREIQKQIKRIELFEEGIKFEKSRNITLKHNYEPRVVSIKLIEVSKSGKKATAIFEWEKGKESREEGVNVEKIIYQVI